MYWLLGEVGGDESESTELLGHRNAHLFQRSVHPAVV
jgi:hypothetical protein